MKILFTGGVPDWTKSKLESQGHEVTAVAADHYTDPAFFAEEIVQYDAYVSGGIESCPAQVIDAGTQLKAILFLGVDSSNYIDPEAAKRNNIPVLCTPGANANAVAELTAFLMFTAARKAAHMLYDMSHQTWAAQTGFELRGKTLGLIGSGAIGQKVSVIAKALGMNVVYHTRSGAKQGMEGTYMPAINDVLAESDIISLHIPKEAGMPIDASAISNMKDGAVLINTSPATLVDANALYDALQSQKLSCAAFDCFYAEGEAAWTCEESKLLQLNKEQFIQTPHAAWRTYQADENMFAMIIDYIEKL